MTDTKTTNTASFLPDFNSVAAQKHRDYRHVKDVVTRYCMAAGGVSVIVAIVLIAFYLFYVVVPMFKPPHIEKLAAYAVPAGTNTETLYYAMEEQHEIGLRVTSDGSVVFFKTADGGLIHHEFLAAETPANFTAFAAGDPSQRLLAMGLDDGTVLLARHEYEVTYPDDVRVITPGIDWPLGKAPVKVDESGRAITMITAQTDEDQTSIAVLTEDNHLLLTHITEEASMLGDESAITVTNAEIPVSDTVSHLLMDVEQRELYVVEKAGSNNFISYYDISDKARPRRVQKVHAVEAPAEIASLSFLSGGISILVGDSQGNVNQWFPVRDQDNNYTLEKIRGFDSQSARITAIAPEYFRKGFLAIDEKGFLGVYHTTAHRTVELEKINDAELTHLAVAPRANAMLVEDNTGHTVNRIFTNGKNGWNNGKTHGDTDHKRISLIIINA